MIPAIAARVLASVMAAILTERFLVNVLVILAEWAVNRWGNDLASDLFQQFKESLDKDHGQPMNLYDEIRRK